jgi:hypothetical protein
VTHLFFFFHSDWSTRTFGCGCLLSLFVFLECITPKGAKGAVRYLQWRRLIHGRSTVAREKDGLERRGNAARKAVGRSSSILRFVDFSAVVTTVDASLEHNLISKQQSLMAWSIDSASKLWQSCYNASIGTAILLVREPDVVQIMSFELWHYS